MMRFAIGTLFLLFSLCTYGQSYRLFTTDRELSSSLINEIYQDRNGMVWIATEDGLTRYDGAKFVTYKHEKGNYHSLCYNYVRTVREMADGRLLIGTYNGVQLYDPDTDSFSDRAVWEDGTVYESTVSSFLELKDGGWWVSGDDLGSITVSADSVIIHSLHLPVPTHLTGCTLEDRRRNIWIMQGDNGIYRLSPDSTARHYLNDVKGVAIKAIYEDDYGDIYVPTLDKGLFKYDAQTGQFITIPGTETLPIKYIGRKSRNECYLGLDGKGIRVFNTRKGTITDYPFENNYFDYHTAKVHYLLEDHAGNLWMAIFQKGVMMIPAQPNNFHYLGYKSLNENIIGSNCITSICRDHEGVLWVGTDNDGIYGITRDLKQQVHLTSQNSFHTVPSTVFGLYEDSRRNLWFGSYTYGMGILDRRSGQCRYVDLFDTDGNKVQRVYDFVEDNQGRVWIATMGAGLFYYDLHAGKVVYNEGVNAPSGQYNWITCLLYTRDNHLYAGAYGGVKRIDLNSPQLDATIITNRHIIYCLYEDRHGNIWIGSSDGLGRWSPQTEEFVSYTTQQGLPSDAVYAIKGDTQDNLWIITNAGMSQFNMQTGQFSNYFVDDGLQGNEFSKNAAFADADGTLWFGGLNGITYFKPQEIVGLSKPWNVRVTDFYLHSIPVRKGMLSGRKPIINTAVFKATDFYLSHEDNSFSIEFATMELDSPERVTYLYAMNKTPWFKLPKGINRVSFSSLAPGTYRFRIKAEDSLYESEATEITIHIAAAWWATWWAKTLYVLLSLLIAGIIFLQHRHRSRIQKEMERHIQAEQLNEAKLQFFIDVSHEIRTPLSLIVSPLQKLMAGDADGIRQKSYRLIYRNLERLLQLMNQLLDIRKIDKGQMSLVYRQTEMVTFIDDLCDTFREQAEKQHITFTFHHEGLKTLPLWIDPTRFDKVVLNILSNAFKFTSDGGHIDIWLATGEDLQVEGPLRQYAEITFADDGVGISPEETGHIFERFYQVQNTQNITHPGTGIGLHLTHSLVELHHGTIRVADNPDGQPGCRFIVRVPLGDAHLRGERVEASEPPSAPAARPAPAAVSTATPVEAAEEKVRAKTKYRVLVAEDDEELRRYICRELAADYHTLECGNGKEALDIIFSKAPDALISDIVMPGMDGFTLCQKVKQNVNLNSLPVILLTARTKEEDKIEGLETGADAYITKPFNMEILKNTVRNLIKGREQLRNAFSGQQVPEGKLVKIDVPSSDEKLMERIMRVVNNNMGNPNLTVDMITKEVGISRVHLNRKLKELTNQTNRDFIRNIRLKQAAELLAKKRYTISEIADLTGFTDPNNFSTAFKELYGIPPTLFMKQHQEKGQSQG